MGKIFNYGCWFRPHIPSHLTYSIRAVMDLKQLPCNLLIRALTSHIQFSETVLYRWYFINLTNMFC